LSDPLPIEILLVSLSIVIFIGLIGLSELILKLAFEFSDLASILIAIISSFPFLLMPLNFIVIPASLSFYCINGLNTIFAF